LWDLTEVKVCNLAAGAAFRFQGGPYKLVDNGAGRQSNPRLWTFHTA